ncbi:MAG: ABC transporter substrate-binding protein [Dehalococcoidia bacterium]
MKKWFRVSSILVAVVLVFTILATACAQQTPAPPKPTGPITIKVGLEQPLSGPSAPWGEAGIAGYTAFVQLFNQAGGFKIGDQQYLFAIDSIDDQGTSAGGIAATKQLIADGCKFIAGHWSWDFPAITAVTNPAKVILVTRTGNEAVPASFGGLYNPQTMPYTVFGNPSREEFTQDCFSLVKAYPNYGVLGLCDSTLGAGAGWDQLQTELDAAGIKYHLERYPPGTQDFSPIITKLVKAGCTVVYCTDIGATFSIAKQRWDLGYKDLRVGQDGPIVDVGIYDAVVGHDASQGLIAQSWQPWFLKETTVNPAYIKLVQDSMALAAQTTGQPYDYTGWVGWFSNHLLILSQAMQQAGTATDPDAIMKAIRGGTFDTCTGKYTMSGAQTYGSPVLFGCPGLLCTIQGEKEVYLSETPWKNLP